ncbi:MAG: hypothetical protein J2P15_23455, partial [Micromonosporaceae bacterium]|nr:hypothetical protein [Micromonosporaceae bacterium]
MAEPRTGWYRRVLGWLRWPLLLAAVAIVIVFLVAQRQSVTTTYGGSGADATVPEGSAGELRGATLPPVDQLQAMVAANRIVRLPGSVASWDQAAVTRAIGTSQVRILVAPPGLKQQQQEQLEADVDNATVVVVGTAVIDVENGLDAVNTVLTDWRDQYGRDDITGLLVTAIDAVQASRAGRPIEASEHGPYATWRDPTATELAPVATALRATGFYAAPGATLRPVPRQDTARAFGTDAALYVALPAQPRDAPAPDYGPALGRLFPGTPIVLMYGDWIEYHGPHATDFAELAGA